MRSSTRRVRLLLLGVLLLAFSGSQTVARQSGVINGVVIETRTNQNNQRAVLVQVQGTGSQTFDQITLEFPRGLLASTTTIVPPTNGVAWPQGWQSRIDGRMLTLSGPPIDYSTGLFRLDLGTLAAPQTLNVNIALASRRLFNRGNVAVTEVAPISVNTHMLDYLVVPDLVTPGREQIFGIRNLDRSPATGRWNVSLQYTANGPMLNVPFKLAGANGAQLVAQLPSEQSIIDDLIAGAQKGGFGLDQSTGRADHLTNADWDALKHEEAQVQSRLVNEFTQLSQGTAAAVTDYLHHMDAYRMAFQRITSSSTGLQSQLAQWEKVHGASQKADMALAVAQLGYGGVKGGAALFRWLTRPQTVAGVTEAGARAGVAIAGQADNAAAGLARSATGVAEAARPNALGLAEQITSAQRGAIQQMAAQAGIDAKAWIARFASLEDAYVALVNQTAASQGLVSLTTPAQRLLERLVVAASNARAGRAGAATAQEIAQLRQWAQQPGFWERLAKATSWFEEPGRLVAGGQEMFQPASQFALTFSADEVALLRALAQSDDAARLASQLGAAADDIPTFVDRLPSLLDTPTFINPGRAPVIPPTLNRLPALDTPTVINAGRAGSIPPTMGPGSVLDDTPTLIDQFIPPTNLPIRLGQQGGALQLLPESLPLGPNGTARLTESAIQGAANEWSTWLNLRSSGAITPAITAPVAATLLTGSSARAADGPLDGRELFQELGGLKGTLHAGYTDRWGDQIFRAEQPITLMPSLATGLQPRLFDATPLVFPGNTFCVCGLFPGTSSSSLRFNGTPIAPVTSSESVTCLQVPTGAPAGFYEISGDPAAGYEASNTVRIGVLTLTGEIDSTRLLRGESTPLRLRIDGTTDSKPIRLRNTTPGIISMTGGDDQVATTSGGGTNQWSGTVTGVRPGPFNITFTIDGPACPCASNTNQWANFINPMTSAGPTGQMVLQLTNPTLSTAIPAGPFPIDFNFRIDPFAAVGFRPAPPLFEGLSTSTEPFLDSYTVNRLMDHAATRFGWHPIPPAIAGTVDRLLSSGLEAVVKNGTIPAADLQVLKDLAAHDGFWNWLAASQSGGDLPLSLRYSMQDILFLQALVQSAGDVAALRQTLGPIKMAALSSLVAQQTASPERARTFATAVNAVAGSDAALQAVDYDTLMKTLWGNNEVYSALKYYGLVSGDDPGLGHFGWLLADYTYGWLTSPIETASRTRASLEAQTAYEEFLKQAGPDLATLGRSANDALLALDRLSTAFNLARLNDPTSALGGSAAQQLRGVLDRMQTAFDQASPAWKAAHASEMGAIRAHIDQKLADLATAIGFLQQIGAALPQMTAWLRSVARNVDGSIKTQTEMFNPEIFVRLGSIALYLENMAAAGLLVADDPTGASAVRGPRNADRRAMTIDDLRTGGK